MKIQIYTTQWCPDCWRAKRFLKENEVAFDEIDIEQDEQAVQLVMGEEQRQANGTDD